MLGNTTTTSGGVAGSLAGTIASDGSYGNYGWWSRYYGNRTSGSEPGNRLMRWLALLLLSAPADSSYQSCLNLRRAR